MKFLLSALLLGFSVSESFANQRRQLISLQTGETKTYQYTRTDSHQMACTERSTGGEDCVTVNHDTTYKFALRLMEHGDFQDAQIDLNAKGHSFIPVKSDLAVIAVYGDRRETGTFSDRSISLGVNIYPYLKRELEQLTDYSDLEVKNGVITFTTKDNSPEVMSGILIQKRKILFFETIVTTNLKAEDIVTTQTSSGFRHEIDLARFNLKKGATYRLSFHRNVRGGDSFPNTYIYMNSKFKF